MDRWVISELDGNLIVSGPPLGVPSIEVVRADRQPGDAVPENQQTRERRRRAAKINFTGKVLIDEYSLRGNHRHREIHVVRPTTAGEEGGSGAYWVIVKEDGRRDDHCTYEGWWLLDLPEKDAGLAAEKGAACVGVVGG